MRGLIQGASVLALLAIASTTQGQQSGGSDSGDAASPVPPPIYVNGGSYYTSSTAVEGGLRGAGSVVRAAGEYNYNTAAGMVSLAEAASRGIANDAAAMNNYFTLKELNDAYQSRHRGPKATGEQVAYISRITAPKRLSNYQIDPVTGEIVWPAILDRPVFAPYRAALDELFAQRVKTNSGVGTRTYEQILAAVEDLQGELKSHIDVMTPAEYVVAKRFLASLAHEAHFSPVAESAANN